MLGLTYEELIQHFPFDEPRPAQQDAMHRIADADDGVIFEMPTGVGKTAVGLAVLKALASRDRPPPGGLFYVTPTKVQLEQLVREYGEHLLGARVVCGRSEYDCIYYEGEEINAAVSPCYMLDCPHRVSMETGETQEEGVQPCPYFQQKYEALQVLRRGGIVLCTTAWYIMNRMYVNQFKGERPASVIWDEVHRTAQITRLLFEHQVTDWYLQRVVDIIRPLDEEQADVLSRFLRVFRGMINHHPSREQVLLTTEQIQRLIDVMEDFQSFRLDEAVRQAQRNGLLNPHEHRNELKMLETITRTVPRMIRSMRFALEGEGRNPLNFLVAFWYREDDSEYAEGGKHARYHLVFRSYFVRGLINYVLGQTNIGYSATIGSDGEVLGYETGFNYPFYTYASPFEVANTRIFVPSDTPSLGGNEDRRQTRSRRNRAIRSVLQAASRFAQEGVRSLFVVSSNAHRDAVLRIAAERFTELDIISYGNGRSARQASHAFREGEGDMLLGTSAQYSEGVDLPAGIAPVIFFLKPGYPNPQDPQAQFEARRFGGRRWALWQWRVIIEALQVRGRNIRGPEDVGVCFFISQQFRNFLYGALPSWLRPAYTVEQSMDECVEETLALLNGEEAPA